MIRKIKEKLCEKTASGSIYLGVVLMIVAFVAVLVCVNLFQLYTAHTRAQLVCDSIADGAAIAGQQSTYFHSTIAMMTANEIFQHNEIPGTHHSYTMETETEYDDAGEPTGCILVKVTYTLTLNAYADNFLNSVINDAHAASQYSATAHATVRTKVAQIENTWLEHTYYGQPDTELPFPTTTPETRIGNYATWLVDYYLCPHNNPLYNNINTDRSSVYLMYDYLKCMAVPPEEWRMGISLQISHTNFLNPIVPSGEFDLSAWERLESAQTIQNAADSGKPTIILCKDEFDTYRFYIVVPHKNSLESNQISVAYADWTNSTNYEIVDWDEFCNTHSEIIAITAD